MTLVAHLIYVWDIQQTSILRTMRRMATKTAFRFHGRMLKDKGPACLGMAFGANHILIGRRAELVVAKGAMGVVTISTVH
jgi:hypothetical protein